MSLLRRIAGPQRRSWDQFLDPAAIPPPSADFGLAPPPPGAMSEVRALQMIAVWACVSLIADTVAQLPLDVYRGQGPERVKIDTPQVLVQPNAELTIFELLHQSMVSLLLRGNSYLWLTPGKDGWPSQITPVHPDMVNARRVNGQTLYEVHGNPETGAWPRGQMLHIRGLTLPGQLLGLSPIAYIRQAIGSGLSAETYGLRWFSDSADPSSVLETDGNPSPEDAKLVQENWITSHGGRRLPAVLGSGYKYRTISIAPEESQFLLTQQWGKAQIATFYRVPPHLIADVDKSTSWGTGIEEQFQGWLVLGLSPWFIRHEAAFSSILPRPQHVKSNVEALLRAKTLERYQAYLLSRTMGMENVDELREHEDLPPLPDGAGKLHTQPLNWGPIDALNATKDNPAPPAPGEGEPS